MKPHRLATLAIAALLCGVGAQAQMYRTVGPDGRVTYTDRPPAADAQGMTDLGGGSGIGGAALPYELAQVVRQYPVTLYTSHECSGCDRGRSLLKKRGVPFTEKTVSTAADNRELEKLTGARALPVLTIGGQRLGGFSENDWTEYLTAAGYPAESKLPHGYRNPAPTPLSNEKQPTPKEIAASTAAAAAPKPKTVTAPEPSIAPPVTSDNPAGLRF